NDHLLKIMVVEADNYSHWAADLLEWLDEVAEIRLKPGNKPAAKSFYYRILFDEPFGGAEGEHVTPRLRRMMRQGYGVRQQADIDGVAERLRAFHVRFAEACSIGVNTEGIEALIDELIPRGDIRP